MSCTGSEAQPLQGDVGVKGRTSSVLQKSLSRRQKPHTHSLHRRSIMRPSLVTGLCPRTSVRGILVQASAASPTTVDQDQKVLANISGKDDDWLMYCNIYIANIRSQQGNISGWPYELVRNRTNPTSALYTQRKAP